MAYPAGPDCLRFDSALYPQEGNPLHAHESDVVIPPFVTADVVALAMPSVIAANGGTIPNVALGRYIYIYIMNVWCSQFLIHEIKTVISLFSSLISIEKFLFDSIKYLNGMLFCFPVYDIDALETSFRHLKESFDWSVMQRQGFLSPNNDKSTKNDFQSPFLHCFAVKSCPLSYILHRAVQAGLGLETVSGHI